MFSLLLSTAYTGPRPFQFPTLWQRVDTQELQGSVAKTVDIHRIFHTTEGHAQYIKLWEEGRRRYLERQCLSSQVTITHDRILLSWRWPNICPWEGVKQFLVLLCLSAWLLLCLLNCLHLNPKFSDFYPSDSLPHPTRGVSEQLCEAELSFGIKPQHINGNSVEIFSTSLHILWASFLIWFLRLLIWTQIYFCKDHKSSAVITREHGVLSLLLTSEWTWKAGWSIQT